MEYSEENISNNDYMKSLLRQIHKLTINNAKLEIENDELKKQLKLYGVSQPHELLKAFAEVWNRNGYNLISDTHINQFLHHK